MVFQCELFDVWSSGYMEGWVYVQVVEVLLI